MALGNPRLTMARRLSMIARRLDERHRIALHYRQEKEREQEESKTLKGRISKLGPLGRQLSRLRTAINLAGSRLAEDLTDYLEWYAMSTFAGFNNFQLRDEAIRLLRHLLTAPFDADAARRMGLVAMELERRGRPDMWEQAKREVQARQREAVA